jgi:hypothetical protein
MKLIMAKTLPQLKMTQIKQQVIKINLNKWKDPSTDQ